jgi:[ribosomal protein S18]-alanine N-acetyltransferase
VSSSLGAGARTKRILPQIRAMRADDLDRVLEIEIASYSMPWSLATFRTLLRRRDADLLVAEYDDELELAGYAASWYVLDQAELGNIAVAEPFRGLGIGALLVETALLRAERRGAREIFLEVRPSNGPALRLYRRFGFREAGRRPDYYSKPVEDALVMRRPLDAGRHTIPSL